MCIHIIIIIIITIIVVVVVVIVVVIITIILLSLSLLLFITYCLRLIFNSICCFLVFHLRSSRDTLPLHKIDTDANLPGCLAG